MANKTITFTVGADGAVSPATEQTAGGQGSHNITEVRFETNLGGISLTENFKVRLQFVDGAGGFYSTGFLDVIKNSQSGVFAVSSPLTDDVTNAGGLAYVYLVVTEITYVDGKATENQVFISNAGKLRFAHSGVGSPSAYAYKAGISSALVNAEIFVGQAEKASNEAKEHREAASSNSNSTAVNAGKAEEAKKAAETAKEKAESAATEATAILNETKEIVDEALQKSNEALEKSNEADSKYEACVKATAELEGIKEDLAEGGYIHSIKEKNKGVILSFWVGTTAEYEALEKKPNNCYVILTDDPTMGQIKNKLETLENAVNDTGWQPLDIGKYFAVYTGDSKLTPQYRKVGNIVSIRGALAPTDALEMDSPDDSYVLFTGLPKEALPSVPCAFLCIGSGLDDWTLVVNTDGTGTLQRYGNSDYPTTLVKPDPATGNNGTWLPFNITYMV